ncbi:COMM domain-containing protein 7-like [Chelonus insularis]|uniref:COMM domain-containing protein 7-like n=1 Tax=Chelonus insularis TaxID=460826 RepID=UPI00158A69FE|nr:COMM domain-containing protein 7-like [Chelonus insularis]
MEIPRHKVIDISWKFGVTAATSESDRTGKTFLQLKLLLDDNGNKRDIFTEMTLSQFYKFLHDLEKAQTSLNFLT